jgi:hypothetical protein
MKNANQLLRKRNPRRSGGCGPSLSVPAASWVVVVILMISGCQSFRADKPWPWNEEEPPPQVEKIMAVWTDAVKNFSGEPSQRGFGGRVFFYAQEKEPIQVKGTVSIYVFDDDRPTSTAPEKKFVFPASSLDQHYSKCPLGDSYSFWIPMGDVGGATRKLSLVARFDPEEQGGSVVSSITRKILPGDEPAASEKDAVRAMPNANEQPIRLVDHRESAPANDSELPGKFTEPSQSHTIELTPSFTRRLQQIGSDSNESTDVSLKTLADFIRQSTKEAIPPAAEPPTEPQSDSALQKSPAPSGQSTPPVENLPRHSPHRAGWQSALPPTPRSGFRNDRKTRIEAGSSFAQRAEQFFQDQTQNPESTQARVEYLDVGSESDD